MSDAANHALIFAIILASYTLFTLVIGYYLGSLFTFRWLGYPHPTITQVVATAVEPPPQD